MKAKALVMVVLAWLVMAIPPAPVQAQDGNAYAQENRREQKQPRGKRGESDQRRELAPLVLPADMAQLDRSSLVLGRPTGNSVTVNVLSAAAIDAYF